MSTYVSYIQVPSMYPPTPAAATPPEDGTSDSRGACRAPEGCRASAADVKADTRCAPYGCGTPDELGAAAGHEGYFNGDSQRV